MLLCVSSRIWQFPLHSSILVVSEMSLFHKFPFFVCVSLFLLCSHLTAWHFLGIMCAGCCSCPVVIFCYRDVVPSKFNSLDIRSCQFN